MDIVLTQRIECEYHIKVTHEQRCARDDPRRWPGRPPLDPFGATGEAGRRLRRPVPDRRFRAFELLEQRHHPGSCPHAVPATLAREPHWRWPPLGLRPSRWRRADFAAVSWPRR